MNDDLIGLKSRKKKYTFSRLPQFPWFTFTISIGFFIINKAIQSVANFTSDTKTIIVIVIITALMVYARYYFGGKNG